MDEQTVIDEQTVTEATRPTAQRIFRYGDKRFPDPGAMYTIQQILDHLKTYFPELGQARIEEQTLADGTREITFSKQVTTKGGR